MKKIISLFLSAFMILTICSCGGKGGGTTQKQNTKFNIDNYIVEYMGFEFVTDDDGKDAIAVNYKFTNNSEVPAQFTWSVFSTYEQNAELLLPAIVQINDVPEYLDDSATKDVQPGTTADVTVTYLVTDKTSPITVTLLRSDFTSESFKIDLAKASADNSSKQPQNEAPIVAQDGLLANTQWYGWWMVCDAEGEYEDYDGAYFDCCVSFEKTNEGYTLMSIWDEIFSDYEDNCLGEIYFREVDGRLASVEGGFFFNGETVGNDKVIINPELVDFENTLFTTVDVEDEDGKFVAALNLTQWGYEWNEEFNDYPTYYDSYFLPLMEDGEALPKDISDIG